MSMKTYAHRKGRFAGILAAACIIFSTYNYSQITLVSPTDEGGFETGTTFAANGWVTAGTTSILRNWYCGSAQSGFSGARCAFIGNTVTNVGNSNQPRLVHLYKTITIPSGAVNIQLSFKYKQAISDNGNDYITVSASPITPVSGIEMPDVDLLTVVDPTNSSNPYVTFTTVTTTIPDALAGSTLNLVFSWHSDDQDPRGQGAVDDVSITYTALPDCSGTPVAGIASLMGPVCNTQSFPLWLSGYSQSTGIQFQWQSSSDGVTFADIAGATSPRSWVTQTAPTYYRAVVTCSFSGLTDTSTVIHVNQTATCYCSASAIVLETNTEKISNVTIGTINNSSTQFVGYQNFIYLSTDLEKGSSNSITVAVVNRVSSDQVIVFIDYNQNGVFTDAGETITTSSSGFLQPFIGSFTVPLTAATGPTRMRIRLNDAIDFNSNPTSCGNADYGQVEDYTVNITCPSTSAPTANGVTVCTNSTATLTASSTVSGVSFSWYDDPNSGVLLTNGASYTTPSLAVTTTYYVAATVATCPSSARTAVTVTVAPAPTVDAGSDVTVCQGNAVTLNAAGTGTISWNNGVAQGVAFTPTTTATYTATAANGTCTATDNVTVTVTPGPTVNAGSDISICQGPPVTLTATVTGTGTLSWDNGITDGVAFIPTTTTTYTATVDNGTCSSSDAVTVTVSTIPTVNAGSDVTVCQGQSVTLTATGTGTFSWSNGISQGAPFIPTTTTTYMVTATNGGCVIADTVTVTVNPTPTVNAGSDISVCQGNAVTLTATGTGTFSWSNGVSQGTPFTPTTTATYTVTAANGTCTATDAVVVTVNSISVVSTSLAGVTITATPAGQSYQWIDCATQLPISGATGVSFTAPANGSYAVIVTNAGGCSATSSCVTINSLGVDEHLSAAEISFYPNPTADKLIIAMPQNTEGIATVYDAQGKLVLAAQKMKNGSSIDLGNIQTGVYMIHLATENGTAVSRIVKK